VSHFLTVPVNENGIIFDVNIDKEIQCAAANPFAFTDVFLYSHGWWNSASSAVSEYNIFSIGFAQVLQSIVQKSPDQCPKYGGAFSPLALAVHWPSMLSEDQNSVVNFLEATSQLGQTTLRAVLGKHELDTLLAEREKLNVDIQHALDMQTDAWGIKVSIVEIKHVDLNESMVRAIARQAEAERERRAKVIHAEGELQASEKLLQAAETLSRRAEAMQLRYLQTLTQIAGDKASTIVFPVPVGLFDKLSK